jgi:putative membrane protein insertion efficiency factor
LSFVIKFVRYPVIGLLRIYRATLSPDHGLLRAFFPHGVCRFHPTCSIYSEEAIWKFGVLKGIGLTISRLSRCHPWHPGGEDPVPKN